MTNQNIRMGEGRLTNAATMVRDARDKFDKDASSLQQRIAGMANQWQGQGGEAFQGLAIKWKDRHEHVTRILGNLAESLDETERDSVANDAGVGEGFVAMSKGLDG